MCALIACNIFDTPIACLSFGAQVCAHFFHILDDSSTRRAHQNGMTFQLYTVLLKFIGRRLKSISKIDFTAYNVRTRVLSHADLNIYRVIQSFCSFLYEDNIYICWKNKFMLKFQTKRIT